MRHLGTRLNSKDIVSQEQLVALGQIFRVENITTTTAGQTSYTVPNGYTVGAVLVFLNGALLIQPTDCTATDASTVVLAIGASSTNDILSVVVLSALRAQDDALLSYTVSQLNGMSPATNTRKVRWCSDMAGGSGMVVSNGTNWIRVADNTLVTT